MSETSDGGDRTLRLNGLTAGEVLAQMRATWRQIEAVRAQYDVQDVRGTGMPPEAVVNLQQLYTGYLTLCDDYAMLTGRVPTNLAAEQAMNDGAPNFFTNETLPLDDPRTVTDRSGRHTITIPITEDMLAAALMLDRLLPHDLNNRLFESIIHIASERLTVEAAAAPADAPDAVKPGGAGDDSR